MIDDQDDTQKRSRKVAPVRRTDSKKFEKSAPGADKAKATENLSTKQFNKEAEEFNNDLTKAVSQFEELLQLRDSNPVRLLSVVDGNALIFVEDKALNCYTITAVSKLQSRKHQIFKPVVNCRVVVAKNLNRVVALFNQRADFYELEVTKHGHSLMEWEFKLGKQVSSIKFPFNIRTLEQHGQILDDQCVVIRRSNEYVAFIVKPDGKLSQTKFKGTAYAYENRTFYVLRGEDVFQVKEGMSLDSSYDATSFQKSVIAIKDGEIFQGLSNGTLVKYRFSKSRQSFVKHRINNELSGSAIEKVVTTPDKSTILCVADAGKTILVWSIDHEMCSFEISTEECIDLRIFNDEIFVLAKGGKLYRSYLKFGNVRKKLVCELEESDTVKIVKPIFSKSKQGECYYFDSVNVMHYGKNLEHMRSFDFTGKIDNFNDFKLKRVTVSADQSKVLCFYEERKDEKKLADEADPHKSKEETGSLMKQKEATNLAKDKDDGKSMKEKSPVTSRILLTLTNLEGVLLKHTILQVTDEDDYNMCNGYFYVKRSKNESEDYKDESSGNLVSEKYKAGSIISIIDVQWNTKEFISRVSFGEITYSMNTLNVYGFSKEQAEIYSVAVGGEPVLIAKELDDVRKLKVDEEELLLYVCLNDEILQYDLITGKWIDEHRENKIEFHKLVFRGKKMMYVGKSEIWIEDTSWKQVVFQTRDEAAGSRKMKFDLDIWGKKIMHYDSKHIWVESVTPNITSTLTSHFSVPELATIKAMAGNRVSPKQLGRLVQNQPNNLKYYFNVAILFGYEDTVSTLLPSHSAFEQDGLILKDQGPVEFAMLNNYLGISKQLIEKCKANHIYNNFKGLKASQEIMTEYIKGLFRQQPLSAIEEVEVPQYAEVEDGIQPIFSSSKNSFQLDLEKLRIDTRSEDSERVHYIDLSKSIDITRGSEELLELLNCYDRYSSDELLNSNASLLIHYLSEETFRFELVEQLIRACILAFNIYTVMTNEVAFCAAGIGLSVFYYMYEVMTMQSFKEHYAMAVNWMDLIIPILCVVTFALGLTGAREVVLSHFTVFFLLARSIFCLKIIRPIKHFLQIMINVVAEVVPFACIIGILTLFFAINGMLVPIKGEPADFNVEGLDSMQGTFLGALTLDYLTDLPPRQKFVKWFIVFSRQLFLSAFMLNGILVGIVTYVYERGNQNKEIITFRERISSLIEINTFYTKLRKLTGVCFTPRKTYLHGFITNSEYKDAKGDVSDQVAELKELVERLMAMIEERVPSNSPGKTPTLQLRR